jgi:hypothetical protein
MLVLNMIYLETRPYAKFNNVEALSCECDFGKPCKYAAMAVAGYAMLFDQILRYFNIKAHHIRPPEFLSDQCKYEEFTAEILRDQSSKNNSKEYSESQSGSQSIENQNFENYEKKNFRSGEDSPGDSESIPSNPKDKSLRNIMKKQVGAIARKPKVYREIDWENPENNLMYQILCCRGNLNRNLWATNLCMVIFLAYAFTSLVFMIGVATVFQGTNSYNQNIIGWLWYVLLTLIFFAHEKKIMARIKKIEDASRKTVFIVASIVMVVLVVTSCLQFFLVKEFWTEPRAEGP